MSNVLPTEEARDTEPDLNPEALAAAILAGLRPSFAALHASLDQFEAEVDRLRAALAVTP